ncbi:MAG: hypothetical protein ACI4V5_00915 [Prevotella sp.]
MKYFLSGLFLLFAMGLTFTACSDDDDNVIVHETTPEIATAGTYAGTWTKEMVGGETTTAPGTLELTAADKYITNVKVVSSELGLDLESVANIAYAGEDVFFSNMNVTNGFGVKFAGSVLSDNTATISFTIVEKSGRKTYTYNYSFEGNKE